MNDEELINSEFGAINDCREHKRLGWIPPEFLYTVKDKTVTEFRGNLFKADVLCIGIMRMILL